MKTLAQIEPRVVIPGGAAYVISQPGSYVLGGNIEVTTGNAITIQAMNVTLDLGGFTLSSTASPANGFGVALASGGSIHVTIFNGHIRGTTGYGGTFVGGGFNSGIDYSSQPRNVHVRDVSVSGVANYGIDLGTDPSTSVTGSTVRIASQIGIRAGVVSGSSATVTGSTGISGTTVDNSVGTLATGTTSVTSVQPTLATVGNIVASLQTENAQIKNALVALGQSAAALPWKITQLNGSARTEEDPSLAFTPGGQPAIAFHDETNGGVRYATFNGSSWQITLVAANASDPSLTFTPGGQPAISYLDDINSDLRYAILTGGVWQTSLVDSTGFTGFDSSLAFSPGGQPAIAYIDQTYKLRYAVFNGTAWQATTVDPSNTSSDNLVNPSLKFTPGGQPAIAYRNALNSTLRYALFNGTSWQLTTVDSQPNTGSYPSLAFAPDGQPAIAYSDATNLRYAILTGSTWKTQAIQSNGFSGGIRSSLKFSPGGYPSIACLANGVPARICCLSFNGATWQASVVSVDSDNSFDAWPSLAFTPDGQPAVAFTDSIGQYLRYAVRVPFAAP